ncbi:UNVERIFIED_CONTAM: hypothetical protein GTU68_052736 [Idotea baltica]|nr:hypothetical protein [Idotea baltica]
MNKQVATFGGGCFWCVDAVIQLLHGVEKVVSGYAGGQTPAPGYREVCGGRTGHAEVVQVTFDADALSYTDLLTVFMTSHDPTQLNMQGADHGSQYRSTIMAHDNSQVMEAQALLKTLQDSFSNTHKDGGRHLTKISSLPKDYHRTTIPIMAAQGYCRVVIDPKDSQLRAKQRR